jgi:hypothetical protein
VPYLREGGEVAEAENSDGNKKIAGSTILGGVEALHRENTKKKECQQVEEKSN